MAVTMYKCPCCGAGISFDSEKQKFVCEYCLSSFHEAELAVKETAKTATEETVKSSETESRDFCDGLLSYTCDNCGATVFADPDTVADHCYYCHNPIVCDGRLSGELKPNKIIPFAYDKAAAEKRFLEIARKKWFVPRDFFATAQVEKISGVYYPFWLADADLDATATADAKRVRTWTNGKYVYTETSHYKLFRAGKVHFEDITTGAMTGEKEMLEGVLPYPSDALQPFTMAYLSGFLGKKRSVEKEAISDEVCGRIKTYSEKMLRETMTGYASVTPHGASTDIHTLVWEYALLPVWVLTYRKGDKTYLYAMNGHTGKVYGEYPISGGKLAILFAIVTAITTALSFVFMGAIG